MTAGYFMSLSGAPKPEYKSALKDENKLFQVKKKKQPPYVHLFFRLQPACYHCHFLERAGRLPLAVEKFLSAENSWKFVPNNPFVKGAASSLRSSSLCYRSKSRFTRYCPIYVALLLKMKGSGVRIFKDRVTTCRSYNVKQYC